MKFAFCVACLAAKDLHHHHLVPRSKGGSNEERNLITLCTKCHRAIHGQSWSGQNHSKLTFEAMQDMKANGVRWCRMAYGWNFVDGKAKRNKDEQKILREIKKRRVKGESYASISRELNRRGVNAKNGGQWHRTAVRSVYLSNS